MTRVFTRVPASDSSIYTSLVHLLEYLHEPRALTRVMTRVVTRVMTRVKTQVKTLALERSRRFGSFVVKTWNGKKYENETLAGIDSDGVIT